jgi:hypothetical protein
MLTCVVRQFVGDGSYAVGSEHRENAFVFDSVTLAGNPQTVTYGKVCLRSL